MSLEYIRKTYHVESQQGRVVRGISTKKLGTILGAHGAYVTVRHFGEPPRMKHYYHPTDLVYLSMDSEAEQMRALVEGWRL